MNVLYFMSKPKPIHEDRLLSAIRQAMPTMEVKTFTDVSRLSEWLKVPPRNFFVAILIPGDVRSLSELMPLRGLLTDRKIIMVVPDNHKESITLIHKFRPHYILWSQDDCQTLISVLENWLTAEHKFKLRIEARTPPSIKTAFER